MQAKGSHTMRDLKQALTAVANLAAQWAITEASKPGTGIGSTGCRRKLSSPRREAMQCRRTGCPHGYTCLL